MHRFIHSFCGKPKKDVTAQQLRHINPAAMLADSAREGYSYANFFAALTAFPVTFHRKLRVLSIIEAAGWPIWPLIICSVVALAIIGERLWSLRQNVVLPKNMLAHAIQAYRQNGVTPQLLSQLSATAPLGQILAAGLRNEKHSAAVMKESIEESSHAVAIELERFLTTLGTIAAISPLLGLFGTVVGMIEIFGAQTPSGTNPLVLAHGISIALYNTAFGLVVAVPSMVFYRYFRAKVDTLLVEMQIQAVKLVEILHGERDA
jgi:biopolymer transport protein ExbB